MNNIIVDFLFAVRPISAELLPENPVKILESYIDFFKPELNEKNIILKTDFIEKSPEILLDEKLFKQVMINLVQNAIVAMPEGGTLTISAKIKDDKYIISVTDNGIGMDKHELERAFDKFYQADLMHKTYGNGIGLAVAKKICELHEGSITVKETGENGTVFEIILPETNR